MRFVDELGVASKRSGFSRSEDQKCFGIFALQCSERDEARGSSVATTLPATMIGERRYAGLVPRANSRAV